MEEVGSDARKVSVRRRRNREISRRGRAIVGVQIGKVASQIEVVDARQLGDVDANLERVGDEAGFGGSDAAVDASMLRRTISADAASARSLLC